MKALEDQNGCLKPDPLPDWLPFWFCVCVCVCVCISVATASSKEAIERIAGCLIAFAIGWPVIA